MCVMDLHQASLCPPLLLPLLLLPLLLLLLLLLFPSVPVSGRFRGDLMDLSSGHTRVHFCVCIRTSISVP